MKIRRIRVDGFRSLTDFVMTFDDGVTLIVGENDSGKTSLIDCLKVVTQGRPVGPDDVTASRDRLNIEVEVENFVFRREYKLEAGRVAEVSFQATPTVEYVQSTLRTLQEEGFDLSDEANQGYVKERARTFGIQVRANSNVGNLRATLLEKLAAGEPVIENAVFPRFNNIQLDGRQFENVPAFFKEVFLKEKQASIWAETVSDGVTVEGFVRGRLDAYSDEVSRAIQERGVLDKLKLFLRDLTDIKVEAVFLPRDLNIDARVKFLEPGGEINIDNKGDGTKRRITMALLEFKKEQALIPHDDGTLYLLDEPDTHLHVKAQLELVETVEGFAAAGNQVILTTHSPFVVNSANPKQVRLLERSNGATRVRFLRENADASERVLRTLGVENTHLFFSRYLLVVEGETEENFVPAHYLSRTGHTLASALIKTINAQGIHNIVGFTKGLLELHDPEKIYVLCDNDASPELRQLMDGLGVAENRRFFVGAKEFEDAFRSDVLHRCWVEYHSDCEREPPAGWLVEEIEGLRKRSLGDGVKFSAGLRELNRGGKKMTKPIFGNALGRYVQPGELPQALEGLFASLR